MTANTFASYTVYYDGACPLCRGEMQLLMQRNATGLLEFVDIAAPGFDPTPLGVSLDAMFSLMHVRDRDGGWFIGIPAFVVIYGATGFDSTARLLANPCFARVAARAYPWLVRHRYRLPHALVRAAFRVQNALGPRPCQDGVCRFH